MHAPQAIETAARARLERQGQQIRHSLRMVREGNPLAAEPEEGRLRARLATVAQVAPAEAERMVRMIQAPRTAAVRAAAARPGAPKAPGGPERIYGDTVDFVGVAFLSQGAAAAKAVARVAYRDGRAQGSGFLVSDRLFLTNHHVITSPEDARGLVLEFGYELDPQRRMREVTTFELDPDAFFLTDDQDDLDYTLVAVGRRISGPRTLGEHGCCPLSGAANKHALGEVANVVQHPDGRYKEVVLRENRLVSRLDKVLHYTADTEPGSSGSPVFNNDWQVIALHHWGGPWRQKADDAGHPVPTEVNEGIRASAIVTELEQRAPGLDEGMRRLLAEALAAPLVGGSGGAGEAQPLVRPPAPGAGPRVNADGSVTWQFPLEVTVRFPGGAADAVRLAPRPRLPDAPPQGERAGAPDADYDRRQGYAPGFLEGVTVPLPRLSAAQKRRAAKNLRAGPGDDPFELKYHHFSVVLDGRRRLAFFTACNLDGTTAKAISRTTGVVKPREPGQGESLDEGAEASETWYVDPRAAKDAQTFQRLYDAQRVAGIATGKKGFLERILQRGHLVRRTDPAWGSDAAALAADADTFHFSNCTPQVGFFNMGKADPKLENSGGGRLWRALEDHVLENAVAERKRVSVFTGPVFDDRRDPPWREHVIPGFRVPLRFWKIVVWTDGGALQALAMLADQSPVLDALPESLEGGEALADTKLVKDFVTTVAEVERLTGLDFGAAVRAADIRPSGSAAGRRPRRVTRPEDLGLAPAPPPAKRTRRRSRG